jgi:hypothetical protein
MKNIVKTIERILAVEPDLDKQLNPIKTKSEKYPGKKNYYWTQLLKILNDEIPQDHPKRSEIKNILNEKKPAKKVLQTFETPTKIETIVGIIPEHLEGKLRKYDRCQIDLAKRSIEAKLVHDEENMIDVVRKMEILELKQRKIWTELKDYFKLWGPDGASTYLIRKKDSVLVLTKVNNDRSQGLFDAIGGGSDGIMRLDPDMIKRFLRGLLPPQSGLLPPPSDDE